MMPARMWPHRWFFWLGAVWQGTAARSVLTAAAALLALPALEIGYRLQSNRSALALADWRAARIEARHFGERGRYDAELGWALKDGIENPGYNTLDYGIRRNQCETEVRSGGILAVGDVFTNGGNEVTDSDTWPAHLERITGLPVLNAGVPGYAADQIILRAEQLLPTVQPHTLVVGLFEGAIARTAYAAYGAPKPYFTLDAKSELVLHAPRRLQGPPPADLRGQVRAALGYSAILDAVLARTTPAYWLDKAGEPVLQPVETAPVAVTCALLQRLKGRAEAEGVRVVLLLQHAFQTVTGKAEPHAEATEVATCAKAMGLETIDQIDALRAVAATGGEALDELYLAASDFDQMSPKGNRATAELLAAALAKTAPASGK